MARVLDQDEQKIADLIGEHDLYIKLQEKQQLLIATIKEVHKPSKLHKFFDKNCKLCKLMGMIE